MFIKSYLTIMTKFKCLESSKDCHFSDKGPSCLCWSCVMILWQINTSLFWQKRKTSLANKNPNKMLHYKKQTKKWLWSYVQHYVRCHTEAGQNVEIILNFFAILTQIDYERVSAECRAVSRDRDILHIFRGRVEMSGDYNCSFHFITHHHCPNYSIQMLCCKKLMIVGIFCHFNQCVWQVLCVRG